MIVEIMRSFYCCVFVFLCYCEKKLRHMKNILKINTIKLVSFKENAYLCIVILKTIFLP